MKLLFLIVAILGLLALWMFRFSIYPASGTFGAYKLDRWTGEVTVYVLGQEAKTNPSKIKQTPMKPERKLKIDPFE